MRPALSSCNSSAATAGDVRWFSENGTQHRYSALSPWCVSTFSRPVAADGIVQASCRILCLQLPALGLPAPFDICVLIAFVSSLVAMICATAHRVWRIGVRCGSLLAMSRACSSALESSSWSPAAWPRVLQGFLVFGSRHILCTQNRSPSIACLLSSAIRIRLLQQLLEHARGGASCSPPLEGSVWV